MKPAPFDYAAPPTLDAALALLQEHGWDAKLLAGGQSLIPVLNFRLAKPSILVDLNRLAELDFIRESTDGGVRIGAMTRQSRLETDPLIAERAPLLHEAIPFVAHPQIRNRGTVGGSLAHADPAAELPAVAVALKARFRLRTATAERWVKASEFFVGLLTTALAADEMLVEIEIPPPVSRSGWCFQEIARRHGDYAQAGVAAMVRLAVDGTCEQARLVYLSVGDGPIEAAEAARRLESASSPSELIDEAARIAAEKEIEPSDDIHSTAEFKRHLAAVVTRRALRTAIDRAAGGGKA